MSVRSGSGKKSRGGSHVEDFSSEGESEGIPEANIKHGFTSDELGKHHRTPRKSQTSEVHYKRTPSLKLAPAQRSKTSSPAQDQTRVYITQFSDDGDDEQDPDDEDFDQQSDFSHDTNRSINIDDDDDEDEESFDSNSLPPPEGVDIDNPEGYDTDLEIADHDFLNTPVEYDPTGVKDYIATCNRLGVIPASFFQRHVEDKQFVMRNHGLGPLGAKAISKPLEGNTCIEKLDLEGNAIEGDGAVHLSKVLKDNCYITHLVLSENNLGAIGAAAMSEMFSENTAVTELDLSGNNFKDSDGEHICKIIETNRTLHTLYLRHNLFEVEAARWIKEGMQANVTLRTLDISWNHFRQKAASYISEMIQENYGLKYLNLAMNGLGNEGALAISKALAQNQCLEEINLSNNRIGDEGVVALSAALEANDTLTTIRLGMNPISPASSMPLLNALYKNDNTSIHLLDLTNVVVTDVFETFLADKIHQEKSRNIQVVHGGVLFKKKQIFRCTTDVEMAFQSDPMTKLKAFAEEKKLRLVDVFRQFDKDQSGSVSHEEFIRGVNALQTAGLEMTPKDIEDLIQRLDVDGDGEIDYKELMLGDNQNRHAKRQVMKWKENQQKMADQGVQTDTFELSL